MVRGQSLVGKIGTVVSAVRGGHRPGDVRIVVNGIATVDSVVSASSVN